jgi:hypothetical protein
MSKKSRKRNKKILAAIGIGLGAAALASRKKKSDLASTEDGKSGSTKITGGTNLNDYDGGTKKPDTTPKDTNKGSGSNVRTRGKIVNSSGDTVASAGTAIANNKSKVTGILPPSQNKGNMYAGVGDTNPRSRNFRKDGGRAEYKSGGRVKGCGKALRGFGKAMKGKR